MLILVRVERIFRDGVDSSIIESFIFGTVCFTILTIFYLLFYNILTFLTIYFLLIYLYSGLFRPFSIKMFLKAHALHAGKNPPTNLSISFVVDYKAGNN